ncbi:diaminohydroxyphosphoribosylaminopyrimidine deaminase [Stackebrandtia endophytica]|uniref:Diaminohydroxyphosphoribosylaminopyrimidine deaminase n=1 Tax=Stackebrandtia endophytica TaxID=1496996 RepID=A0A543B2Z0_9ACTN|nr:deaminase [Stackebrandtia endophytica]TQL79191.1 diaminohydroxyphosphoribosylaminopyrimidine deaminase [Stackebrandtia endophytica]
MDDLGWLRTAVELGRRCPPSATAFSVGAVIVADDQIIAEGFSRQTDPADHAEEVALRHAAGWFAAQREQSTPAAVTIYSSLEPCGQRASRPHTCTDLILQAGLRRVVFALAEPETFVQPRGAALLRAAGVEVVHLPQLADEVADTNAHLR